MSVWHSFRENLQQRLQAILWRTVASDLETDALLQDAENLNRVEQRARQFEAEGKPQLAETLRTRAARIDPDSPGGTAVAALAQLALTPDQGSRQLTGPQAEEHENKPAAETTAPARSRRTRRRRAPEMETDRED